MTESYNNGVWVVWRAAVNVSIKVFSSLDKVRESFLQKFTATNFVVEFQSWAEGLVEITVHDLSDKEDHVELHYYAEYKRMDEKFDSNTAV